MTLETIVKILNKHDPIGLVKMGAPEDEYCSEARKIFEMIINESQLVGNKWVRQSNLKINGIQTITHAVFISQFSEKIAGSRTRYKKIAEDIYKEAKQYKLAGSPAKGCDPKPG